MLVMKSSAALAAIAVVFFCTAPSVSEASERARSNSEIRCLAEMVYHEARGESTAGQEAVAEVIINRAEHPSYPSNLCSVVRQKGQFSPHKAIREKAAFRKATDVAERVASGEAADKTSGATHFHTPGVSPSWSRKFERTRQIGSHIFYRQSRSASR